LVRWSPWPEMWSHRPTTSSTCSSMVAQSSVCHSPTYLSRLVPGSSGWQFPRTAVTGLSHRHTSSYGQGPGSSRIGGSLRVWRSRGFGTSAARPGSDLLAASPHTRARWRGYAWYAVVEQSPPPIVSFAQLPAGWHAYAGDPGVYVLSWHYRENSSGWAPSMPRDGIAVTVFFPTTPTRYPKLRLVIPRHPATTLEGALDTPEYRIRGRVDNRNVAIWIDIRRPHPTTNELRIAQRVIAALRFK
jgi:hypothetical protein